jgi:hypothetical protein
MKNTSARLPYALSIQMSTRRFRYFKARTAKAGNGNVTSVAAMAMKLHFY